ncbi:PaaI family thioesterase [Aspergillus lucknowensis]|uniref:HotDog domain-containing protein n=1 Tax=Aspergillus lucknowensis TaxID=176173 RepID=A0ABR4M1S3_9EURO
MTDDSAHFQSIPWVAQLLRDDSFVTTPFRSRIVKSSTEDSLYSTTINSPSTISATLTQYRRAPPSRKPLSPSAIPTDELRIFVTLGSDLNGYPGVLHGGMVATLLDEAMGYILSLNITTGEFGQVGPVTAYLNIKFVRPVITPGTVVVSGKIAEVKDNKKWKINGDIRDKDGTVLAEAECLYIQTRSKL